MTGQADKPRWFIEAEKFHGNVIAEAVTVRDREWLKQRRWSIASHGAVIALGLVMIQALGVGWALVPLASVAHWIFFSPKRILLATTKGLLVVEIRATRVEPIAQIPLGAGAALTLLQDEPQVQLAIFSETSSDQTGPDQASPDQPGALLWEGTFDGIDLKLTEEVIRGGGGEPVRIKR